MRIKKTSQTTPVQAEVVNTYSTSQENAYSCDYINDMNTHSSTEQRIGTWTNGKPLYRKTYYASSLADTGTVTIPLSITNLEDIYNIYGVASNGSVFFPLPCYRGNPGLGLQIYADTTSGISITSEGNRTSYHASVTVEYTKTS